MFTPEFGANIPQSACIWGFLLQCYSCYSCFERFLLEYNLSNQNPEKTYYAFQRFSVSVRFPPIIACNKKVKIQLYIYI